MWGKLYGDFIISGRYGYSLVVEKRPDLKNEIDDYLLSEGRTDLIV
ncbi:hypothetical protein [Acidaminobacter sp. JC074]|nr:hypothetical protein [Acidaminobacter sp. JC074]